MRAPTSFRRPVRMSVHAASRRALPCVSSTPAPPTTAAIPFIDSRPPSTAPSAEQKVTRRKEVFGKAAPSQSSYTDKLNDGRQDFDSNDDQRPENRQAFFAGSRAARFKNLK